DRNGAAEAGYLGGRLFAVQLHVMQADGFGDFGDGARRFVDEDADGGDALGQAADDGARLADADASRAAREKIEAEEIHARFAGAPRVRPIGDAADFYLHVFHGNYSRAAGAAINSRRPRAGSGLFIRCSPIRKASKPASRSRWRSSCVRRPDSLTAMQSWGIISTSEREVSTRTWKSRRSRLLTPMMRAPAASARSTSSRACTSTRGSMASERPRSSNSRRAASGSTAAISRKESAP